MEVKKKKKKNGVGKAKPCSALSGSRVPPGDAFRQSVKQGHRRDPVLENRLQDCQPGDLWAGGCFGPSDCSHRDSGRTLGAL